MPCRTAWFLSTEEATSAANTSIIVISYTCLQQSELKAGTVTISNTNSIFAAERTDKEENYTITEVKASAFVGDHCTSDTFATP